MTLAESELPFYRPAVGIMLLNHDGRVFVGRRIDMPAGLAAWQMPQGGIDPGETPRQAALRELQEEVGLTLHESTVLGVLDDYGTRSGYIITPVVVWAEPDHAQVPNPAEVAKIYRVPLDDLEGPDVPRLISIPESDRPVIQLPLLGTLIHAPTAAVLYQMREVVVHGRATRVNHFEQPVWAWR